MLGYIWLHTTLEGPWLHYMLLEVCWDNLRTLSFGLSQFHGHGTWLMCEVALSSTASGLVSSRFLPTYLPWFAIQKVTVWVASFLSFWENQLLIIILGPLRTWAMTTRLWEPKRKCPKAVTRRFQNHVVCSRALKCSVKSDVTKPLTKCYFNKFPFINIKIE